MELSYERKGNAIFINCDKKYDSFFKNMGCKYDDKNKLWVTSKSDEKIVSNFINKENERMLTTVKSISNQKKYVKDIEHDILNSSDEDEDEKNKDYESDSSVEIVKNTHINASKESDSMSSSEDEELPRKKQYLDDMLRKKSDNEYRNKYNRRSDRDLTFNKDSIKFSKSLSSVSSKNSLSSSSRSSSSSEDFPSPETPKKRVSYMKNSNNYEVLLDQINALQKRVLKIEKRR